MTSTTPAAGATPSPPAPLPRGNGEVAALLAIVAVGVAVRVHYLGVPIRCDEAHTHNEYARLSAYDAVSLYTFPNNHLFHSLLVHVAIRLLGPEPWVLRLPALAAGVALIPATWRMTRGFAGITAGLFAAALVAGSEPLVDYSANARGYSLVALATVALVVAAREVRLSGRPAGWAGLVLLPPLGMFTIPVMLLPWGGIIAWLVVTRFVDRQHAARLDRLIVATLVSSALALLLYAPALLRTGLDSVVANPFVTPRSTDELTRHLPTNLARTWAGWNTGIPWPVTAGFVAAWLISLGMPSPQRQGARALTGLLAILSAAGLAFVAYQRRVPFERVWLYLVPIYLACVGSGLAALAGRLTARPLALAATPVVLAFALAGVVISGGAVEEEAAGLSVDQGDALAVELRGRLGPRSALVCAIPTDGALRYHMIRNGVPLETLYDGRRQGATTVYLVVNRHAGQTAAGVAGFNHLAREGWGRPPIRVREFGGTDLFRIDR